VGGCLALGFRILLARSLLGELLLLDQLVLPLLLDLLLELLTYLLGDGQQDKDHAAGGDQADVEVAVLYENVGVALTGLLHCRHVEQHHDPDDDLAEQCDPEVELEGAAALALDAHAHEDEAHEGAHPQHEQVHEQNRVEQLLRVALALVDLAGGQDQEGKDLVRADVGHSLAELHRQHQVRYAQTRQEQVLEEVGLLDHYELHALLGVLRYHRKVCKEERGEPELVYREEQSEFDPREALLEVLVEQEYRVDREHHDRPVERALDVGDPARGALPRLRSARERLRRRGEEHEVSRELHRHEALVDRARLGPVHVRVHLSANPPCYIYYTR